MTTQNPFEDTDEVLDRITDKFDERYEGSVDRDTIETTVRETYDELSAEARVETMLPAVTEHEVGDKLAEEFGRPAPLVEDAAEADDSHADLRAGAAGSAESDPHGVGRPVL
ncbi:three-helix bundle dimerization domain-containing protein [Cryptosporangium sp. NPDC051539]|uniref:three-helix bundle dimerization domain-containing protein n=1 Tax=Cryptosporangium sp. NPDC051539 TaxID=3363962 RepID=UPI0037A944FB